MALTSIPSTGLSTLVASALTTIYTATGKQKVTLYVNNSTTTDTDVNIRTGTTSGATETITVTAKKKFLVYDGIQPNGGIIQLSSSGTLVYEGYAVDVS